MAGRSISDVPNERWKDRHFESTNIHGIAVDEAGSPLKARVAVVAKDGSNSSTQVGPFSIPTPKSGPATLTATTEDGLINWMAIGADDMGPHTLVVNRPGAFLELELDLGEPARVAVYQGGVRLHDVTLRPHNAVTLVVPVGDIEFGLTGHGSELNKASFTQGQRNRVRLPSAARPGASDISR